MMLSVAAFAVMKQAVVMIALKKHSVVVLVVVIGAPEKLAAVVVGIVELKEMHLLSFAMGRKVYFVVMALLL
jgi:hypothetical protein